MSRVTDPKIHLGIDNCFAIKRWVSPTEWGRVVRDLGLKYVEAVPDLECEPMLTPEACQRDWADETKRIADELDVHVVMSYSNDSTYDTIGFSHPDARIRDYLVEKWFGNFIRTSAAIGSDIGYYVQATPENMLGTKEGRMRAKETAFECMVRVNRMAGQAGIAHVALEQMYTPHQPPFSIEGMRKLIQDVTKESGGPFYFTEDVGHHCPFYTRPDEERLQKACRRYALDGYVEIWLGSEEAYRLFTASAKKGNLTADEVKRLTELFEENDDAFNTKRDTDCYEWLRSIGAWSPVIHMQQTNGKHSSHAPFTPDNNADGIIDPVRILKALQSCYAELPDEGMPPVCEDIYLIQELYMSTKDIGYQGLYKIRQSTDYLRRFIPRDGMRLSELLKLNGCAPNGDV